MLFRASGGRVVDFTNYVFASIKKTFSNRETPIGKVPIGTLVALWLLHCMPCKEMHGRYRSVHIVHIM